MSDIVRTPPDFAVSRSIRERLRPLEWVASIAAAAMFLAIVSFLIWGMLDWASISVPRIGPGDQSKTIGDFKALSDAELERVTRILDLIVTKTLLPVFTTVIGYLLGKRE